MKSEPCQEVLGADLPLQPVTTKSFHSKSAIETKIHSQPDTNVIEDASQEDKEIKVNDNNNVVDALKNKNDDLDSVEPYAGIANCKEVAFDPHLDDNEGPTEF